MSEVKLFLDLFTYKNIETNNYTIYKDCIILKDFDTFKKGQEYEAIAVHVQLHGWNGDNDEEASNYL
jgi:hypothetical protein